MRPRVVKRGATAAGARKTARTGRGAAKSQNQQPESANETPKVEERSVVDKKPVVEETVAVEEKTNIEEKQDIGVEPTSNGLASLKKEEEVKESVDEYGKDERLELDDNEPEYEPEEYVGVDYDDKEIEQEDVQAVVDEVAEDPEEENVGEEEEGDLVEEELEDVPEEVEGEEDDEEQAGEEAEHAEMVDGEEEEEHHEVVKERRKRKEYEVFVGGLDKDATEADLRKVFSRVGDVTEVRLMMNPQTKKNKGFAFLRFATVVQAKRAVTELKNPVVTFAHDLFWSIK